MTFPGLFIFKIFSLSLHREEILEKLPREKNLAAIAGGILLFAGHAVCLIFEGTASGIISKTVTFSAHLLLALGILGIYESSASPAGAAGKIGAVLAVLGTIAVTAVVFVEIAAAGGADAGPVLHAPSAAQIAFCGPFLFVIGLIMLGSAIGMTKTPARTAGWMLVAGTLVFAIDSLFSSTAAVTATAGGAVAGFVRLGILGLLR